MTAWTTVDGVLWLASRPEEYARCGSGLLMAPGQADLGHAELGPHLAPHLARYVMGHDEGGPACFRLLKLAWEYACDSFSVPVSSCMRCTMSGSLTTNKQRLATSYDTSAAVALAKTLAGLSAEGRGAGCLGRGA